MTGSNPVAAVFDRVADDYDHVGVPWFTPIAEHLIRELAPQPGQRMLDIGTGRGAALWPLAAAVGQTGSVTAIDISERMIAATNQEATERALAHVTIAVGDAQRPALAAESFDAIASSLVLFYIPDPAAALSAWIDLLVPGGRLGISTFGPRSAGWVHLDEVFSPYLSPGLIDARTAGIRGPFASDAGVEGLLRDAGFVDIRTSHLDVDVILDNVEQWRIWTQSHGQITHWAGVPDTEFDAVMHEAAARLEPMRRDDGRIALRQQVRYTFGARSV